jgi:hypothetical protein
MGQVGAMKDRVQAGVAARGRAGATDLLLAELPQSNPLSPGLYHHAEVPENSGHVSC